MIKIRFVSKALCLVVFSLFVQMGLYAQNEKPFVVPELKEWKGSEGAFIPSADMRVVYAQDALRSVAEAFAADYGQMFGVTPKVIQGKPSAGDIYFTLKKDKKLGREGYAIRTDRYVTVSAPEAVGAYWATRTLLQMSEQTENHQLPKGQLRDWPDYAMRGFMMDCGRKFIPMPYMRDLVKMMAYYKMNTLQVHLNGFPSGVRYLSRPHRSRRLLHQTRVYRLSGRGCFTFRRDYSRNRCACPYVGFHPLQA